MSKRHAISAASVHAFAFVIALSSIDYQKNSVSFDERRKMPNGTEVGDSQMTGREYRATVRELQALDANSPGSPVNQLDPSPDYGSRVFRENYR